MRTITEHGAREQRKIDDQIERAKIALCIEHFNATGEVNWLKLAGDIAKRANGFWSEVSARIGADDLVPYLLGREVSNENGDGEFLRPRMLQV